MRAEEFITEKWSAKYKRSINCNNPRGFSQRAHCQGRKKNESEELEENLRDWFKEKWVRFNPQGKIMGACARGSESEGKPKCLPQKKAHALGKKGRASAAARKRREDPNPERRGAAKNVATREAQLDELTFKGSQCTKDCSGHRAGYEWQKRTGRTAQSWSPSFNKGAAIAASGQ